MTLRTVVVCTECQFVWQVVGMPERTTCQRCQKSHQFKKLKHFYSSEDRDASRQARSLVQARVNGNEDQYESAKERQVLKQQVGQHIKSDDYLQEMGVDIEEVKEAAERAKEQKPDPSKSKKTIMVEALDALAQPDMESAIEYCEARGLDPERARNRYEKMIQTGEITQAPGGALRRL